MPLPSRAFSHTRGHFRASRVFARRTKKKEELLVVYQGGLTVVKVPDQPVICSSTVSQMDPCNWALQLLSIWGPNTWRWCRIWSFSLSVVPLVSKQDTFPGPLDLPEKQTKTRQWSFLLLKNYCGRQDEPTILISRLSLRMRRIYVASIRLDTR